MGSKSKKRKREHSSDSSSDEKHHKKKLKKEKKRKKEKKHKKQRSSEATSSLIIKDSVLSPKVPNSKVDDELEEGFREVLQAKSKSMAPMTKEEWDKQQSVIKKVYDPVTGRERLIKGTGEVLEEIVSKNRHREINKQATKGDGDYFQLQLKKP